MTLVLPEVRWQDDDRFVEAAALVCDGNAVDMLEGFEMLEALGYPPIAYGDVAALARLRVALAIARGERRLYARKSA